jgi:hypothetical protein
MPRPSPIEKLWLQQQFAKLHAEHTVIIAQQNKQPITPELEKQVRRAMALAKRIDDQVPDKNVPPD